MQNKDIKKKAISIIILICVALLSITVISKNMSSVENHMETIAALDEKKVTAMELTAAVAITSTAISAIPGDAATPIANQLSELTTPLLIVVCAIYLEKFLLTTIGYVSYSWIIPIACDFLIGYVLLSKEFLRSWGIKLAIFGVAISLVIPVSVKVTNMIENTFDSSISQTFEKVEEITDSAEESNEKQNSNVFVELITGIKEGVTNLTESAKNAISYFIDAIAVLVITTCVIPVAVLFIFVWIVKILFDVKLDLSVISKKIENKQ